MRKNFDFLVISFLILAGCSSSNPIANAPKNDLPLPDNIVGTNIAGVYELVIDSASMTAEISPQRNLSLGESLMISGKSYFDMSPCKDCFRITGLGYKDGSVEVKFRIEHPFKKGNPVEPPSAKNRLDLDIFDPAVVVLPNPLSTNNFPLSNINVASGILGNPSGYTRELAGVTGGSVAFPYVLVIDDSATVPPSATYNKLEMGATADFIVEFTIPAGQTLSFDLYLTFGYGSSAVLKDRFNPRYLNPEFNRKAAWKVEATPPNGDLAPAFKNTWDDADTTTLYDVTVKVYDWQVGANVNPVFDQMTDIYAASGVSKVTLEIPGMHNTISESTAAISGDGTPSNPLVYKVSVANQNSLPIGEYTGLVAVYDERATLQPAENRDYLIHTPDGGKTLNQHEIPVYVTYQTFTASVVEYLYLGDLMWAKQAGGAGSRDVHSITTLSDDSIVVTGDFWQTMTFGKGLANEITLTSEGMSDIYIARYDSIGNFLWVKSAGGVVDEYCYGIASLPDDTFVVTGNIWGPAIFGKGESMETTLIPTGGLDFFIAKYNINGNLQWVKHAGGSSSEVAATGQGIAPLSDNSSVVIGDFNSGTVIFGLGEPTQTSINFLDQTDLFIAKYNEDGSFAWAKHLGGYDIDGGESITSLPDDSIGVTGLFYSNAVFGKGEPNETTLSSLGYGDIFVARYNPDGTLQWAKRAGSDSYEGGKSIAGFNDDSLVAIGNFYLTSLFGQGEPNETNLTASPSSDIFIAKYNPDGTLSWAKKITGQDDDYAASITSLPDNSFALTGYFVEELLFGEGEPNQTTLYTVGYTDAYIARYNPNGTLAWVKRAGGISQDEAYAITALSDSSTAISGMFYDTCTFGAGEPNEIDLTPDGDNDIFIARFAP